MTPDFSHRYNCSLSTIFRPSYIGTVLLPFSFAIFVLTSLLWRPLLALLLSIILSWGFWLSVTLSSLLWRCVTQRALFVVLVREPKSAVCCVGAWPKERCLLWRCVTQRALFVVLVRDPKSAVCCVDAWPKERCLLWRCVTQRALFHKLRRPTWMGWPWIYEIVGFRRSWIELFRLLGYYVAEVS
jgi:hypothetical protein